MLSWMDLLGNLDGFMLRARFLCVRPRRHSSAKTNRYEQVHCVAVHVSYPVFSLLVPICTDGTGSVRLFCTFFHCIRVATKDRIQH